MFFTLILFLLAGAEVRPGDIAYTIYSSIMLKFAIPLVISFIIGLETVYAAINSQLGVIQLID